MDDQDARTPPADEGSSTQEDSSATDDGAARETQTVVDAVTANRSDLPRDEVQERSTAAVKELGQGTVAAFTVPLAVNRVRDEMNAEHGHADATTPMDADLGETEPAPRDG